MKLCLISPPMTVASRDGHLPQVPPLGVAYLAASARQAGHEVSIVDGLGEALDSYHRFIGTSYMNGLTVDQVVQRVGRDNDLIGLSVMFSKQWPLARRLLSALRKEFPATPLVVGGEHVSAATRHVFQSSPADYAVIGEGEETLLQLMETLGEAKLPDSSAIEGLAFRADRLSHIRANRALDARPNENVGLCADRGDPDIVITRPRQRRRDLDSIPWPAWDLVPIREYIAANRFQDCSDRRVMVILGTRGCPYRCRFCSSPQMWTTSFYMRDPRDLVDEMEFYMHAYGAAEFQFQDLTFVINRNWVIRVADEIIRRQLDIVWTLPGGTRSEAFDAEVMRRLSASGCTSLTFAPESGSQRVLDDMLKKTNPERFIELGKIARQNRINVALHAFIIIGSPEETLRDLLRTYWFICRLALVGYDGMLCSRFTCYPGSEYHRRYLDSGLVEYNDDYFLDLEISFSSLKNSRSWHPRWGARRIKWFITTAYLLFFVLHYASRPVRVVRSTAAVLRNRPRTRLEAVFAHSFARRWRRVWNLLGLGGRTADVTGSFSA